VRDVFQQEAHAQLKGNVGIGHVRYPTAGAGQRTMRNPSCEIALRHCLGHNGNLTNARELTEVLVREAAAI